MSKRIIIVLSALALCLIIIITAAIPDGSRVVISTQPAYSAKGLAPTISLSSATGKKGDTVKLTLTIANNPGLIALRLAINYDKSYMSLTNIKDGSIFSSGAATFGNDYSAVPFYCYWEDALATADTKANGTLATLSFKINKNTPSGGAGVSVTLLDAYNYDLKSVDFEVLNGKLTMSETVATSTTTSKPMAGSSTTTRIPEIDTELTRLSGANRIGTAIAISKKGWKKADTVIVANSLSYPDALAGAPLAYTLDAPILLTANSGTAESAVLAEITRLGAKNIYILGGSSAVSEQIRKEFAAKKLSVKRVSGENRYETAVAIAKELSRVSGKSFSELFIVSGANFPDALAISSIAAIKGCPILYAPTKGAVDGATASYISDTGCKKATLLGGTAAVSTAGKTSVEKLGLSVTRVSGDDRYATALAIYKRYDSVFKGKTAAIATGANFPDALAGGAYAAKLGEPVILVGKEASAALRSYVGSKKLSSAFILGGDNAVSDAVAYSLFA